MSTVFDVTSVEVQADTNTVFAVDSVQSVTISDDMTPVSVTVDATDVVSQVNVEVPGIQGPPGLQNVHVGLTNPATIPGEEWGMAEKGYIWIEVNI